MNSLRDIVQLQDAAQPLAPPRWDWSEVRKVLLVRLRSIGDTVLATPSAVALKRFLPHVQVDILVEDWVAPLLDHHPHIDNVVVLERGGLMSRARVARELRASNYDVVYNLHGGTTATFLTRATASVSRLINTHNFTITSRRRLCCSGDNRKPTPSNNNSHCSVGPEFR
jgi:ADP-heptose:LPS heptosyltransferase